MGGENPAFLKARSNDRRGLVVLAVFYPNDPDLVSLFQCCLGRGGPGKYRALAGGIVFAGPYRSISGKNNEWMRKEPNRSSMAANPMKEDSFDVRVISRKRLFGGAAVVISVMRVERNVMAALPT